jgi:hypothetical protein
MTSAISPMSGDDFGDVDSPGTFVETGGLSGGATMASKTFPFSAGRASQAWSPRPSTGETMPLSATTLFGIVGHLMQTCLHPP